MNATMEPSVAGQHRLAPDPVKLSATRVKMYLQCPRQYRFQYVDCIPTQISGALAFGNVIHQVLHNIHQWSLAHGEPLNESVALYEFSRIWDETVDRDVPLFKDYAELVGYSGLASTILIGYIEEHRDKPAPILLEHPFEIEAFDVPDDYPFTLRGVIDRVDEEDDGLVIVDFKSGKRKPSPKILGEDLQLTIYAYAAWRLFGQNAKRVVYYHLRDQTQIPVQRSEEELALLEEVVLPSVATGIACGQFDPRPGFYCRFCDFRHLCDQEGGVDLRRYDSSPTGEEPLDN